MVANPSDQFCLLGLEFVMNLSHFRGQSTGFLRPEQREFWTGFSNRLTEDVEDRIEKLAPQHFGLAYDLFRQRKIALKTLVEWHGSQALFRDRGYVIFPGTVSWSVAGGMLGLLVGEMTPPPESVPDCLEEIREVGRLALAGATQPIKEPRHRDRWSMWFLDPGRLPFRGGGPIPEIQMDADLYFGAFWLMGCWFEVVEGEVPAEHLGHVLERQQRGLGPAGGDLSLTLLARARPPLREQMHAKLVSRRLRPEQQAFICRWANGEFNILARQT